MPTERYFAFRNNDCYGVWDRHKNKLVASFPRSAEGEQLADEESDRLNAAVRAREEG